MEIRLCNLKVTYWRTVFDPMPTKSTRVRSVLGDIVGLLVSPLMASFHSSSSAAMPTSPSSMSSRSLGTSSSEGPAEFYVAGADFGIQMTKLFANESPPTFFDCIGVFAIPINNLKQAAKISEKITHSVVLLLSRASGAGYMLEFTNNNGSGIVHMVPGRIAKKDAEYLGKHPYGQLNSLHGFFECSMHLATLEDFNNKFTTLSSYHNLVHNCHVYHRSLVASAVSGRLTYNLRQDKRYINQLWNSHDWVYWEESIITREDIRQQTPLNCKLKAFVVGKEIADAVIKNMAVTYNPEVHTTIAPVNMDLNIFNKDMWTAEIDGKLAHGVRTKNYTSLLTLLRECASCSYMNKTVLDAMDFMLSTGNVIISMGDVGHFRKLIESSKVVYYSSVRSDIDQVRTFSLDDVRTKLGVVMNLLIAIAEKNESKLVKAIADCQYWKMQCDALDEANECLEGLKKQTVMV